MEQPLSKQGLAGSKACRSTAILTVLSCSMREAGLWDYVVVNDDLEETMKEMSAIAQRCLLGRVGNATDKPAPPTTAQKEVGQAS